MPVLSATPKLSLDEEKIYDALSGGMQLSSSELALKTGFSRDKVIRLASGLLEKRYIRTVGKGRGTKYTL